MRSKSVLTLNLSSLLNNLALWGKDGERKKLCLQNKRAGVELGRLLDCKYLVKFYIVVEMLYLSLFTM